MRGGSAGASRCRLSLVADAKAAHALLAAAGPSLPRRALVPLLRLVLDLSRDPACRPALRSAAATPKLVRFLQWDDFATRDVAMRCLRNVCEDDAKSLEQAAVAGAVPHLVAVAAPECVAATTCGTGLEVDLFRSRKAMRASASRPARRQFSACRQSEARTITHACVRSQTCEHVHEQTLSCARMSTRASARARTRAFTCARTRERAHA